MRRLVILSTLLLAVIAFGVWLVLPMFVSPVERSLEECDHCDRLLAFVPDRANRVLVVPHGGTSLFEIGRRIVPGPELSAILPPPGLFAIALGDAPVVAWQDDEGQVAAVAAPRGVRRVLLWLATYRYRESLPWRGDLVTFGEIREGGGGAWAQQELHALDGVPGHFFALHDEPSGKSFARLTPNSLEIRTFPSAAAVEPARTARHSDGATFSLAVPRIEQIVEPVEPILPVRTAGWHGRPGQIVIYRLRASGLLPSLEGLLLVDDAIDARTALALNVPKVEGATRDSQRKVGNVEVFRRETLGMVVDMASVDGRLAIAFDGTSMERMLTTEDRLDSGPSIWSFSGDPGALAQSIDGLMSNPARHLLNSSSQRTLSRLGEVAGALRNATSVRSRQVAVPGGTEIESQVVW